jgi:hypothetical protein
MVFVEVSPLIPEEGSEPDQISECWVVVSGESDQLL